MLRNVDIPGVLKPSELPRSYPGVTRELPRSYAGVTREVWLPSRGVPKEILPRAPLPLKLSMLEELREGARNKKAPPLDRRGGSGTPSAGPEP